MVADLNDKSACDSNSGTDYKLLADYRTGAHRPNAKRATPVQADETHRKPWELHHEPRCRGLASVVFAIAVERDLSRLRDRSTPTDLISS